MELSISFRTDLPAPHRRVVVLVSMSIATPLSTFPACQNAIGDGGLYSIWTGLILLSELCTLLVLFKGRQWRERAEAREAARG